MLNFTLNFLKMIFKMKYYERMNNNDQLSKVTDAIDTALRQCTYYNDIFF